jgi:hypothetical protein
MELGKNYIHLGPDDLDRKIYRVFSLARLLELVSSKQNVLVKPVLWDDPFENFILRATAKYEGRNVHFEAKDFLYGQCWSLNEESDAMWRIYSPTKDGVKVSTTIRKLLESLAVTAGDFARISCFIGKVQYQSEADLVDLLDDQQLMASEILHPSGTGQAWTLMFKRQEFSHEEEVRLVYFNHDKSYTGDLFSYPIGDPSQLIDEVVFDPRLPKVMFAVFKDHLEKEGFRGRVSQSKLYRLPQLEVNLYGVSA